MNIKEFIEACREFTEYAQEIDSDTGWILDTGASGPIISFRISGTRSYGAFQAIIEGWEAIHDGKDRRKPLSWDQELRHLELSKVQYAKVFKALYCVQDHNKRLRRDLVKACGLLDQLEAKDKEFARMRAEWTKSRKR